MVADCPSGFCEATTRYVRVTPGFECPLIDNLRAHMDVSHNVVRIYMSLQELFADLAMLILDIPIPGTTGERIFAKLCLPPANGFLLVGRRAFIVGYGLTGLRQKENSAAFGTFTDFVKYGAFEALARNTRKLVDISGDASFGEDNDLNVRGISANIESDLPTAGAGTSGALVIWGSNKED
jgi:hypothetical protein